jgi:hypothetical protein
MIAFVHIEKSAGTTLKFILRQSFGASHCDIRLWPEDPRDLLAHPPKRILTPRDLHRTRWVYPTLSSFAGHAVAPYGELAETRPDIRFWTMLRDPVARAASHYQHLRTHRGLNFSFEEFIDRGVYNNWQTRKLCGEDNFPEALDVLRNRLWFVGLVEKFNETLLLLKKQLNNPRLEIRHEVHNRARNPGMKRQILDDLKSRALLEEANQNDIALYRHAVKEVYARQVREYGPTLAEDVAALVKSNENYRPPRRILATVVRDLLYKPLLPFCSRGQVYEPPVKEIRRAA